jgi:hypothetical protein
MLGFNAIFYHQSLNFDLHAPGENLLFQHEFFNVLLIESNCQLIFS